MIFLLIHLNYDSAMTNEQVSSARENLFVSATNEDQSQWSMKHSKVCTFSVSDLMSVLQRWTTKCTPLVGGITGIITNRQSDTTARRTSGH
jgi:hypothetical protein